MLSSIGKYAYYYLSQRLLHTRDTHGIGSEFYGFDVITWRELILVIASEINAPFADSCIYNGFSKSVRPQTTFSTSKGLDQFVTVTNKHFERL